MAETMQFDLVSPERRLASVQATEVQIPGTEGDMTAMAAHAPTITTLRPGILRVTSAEGTAEYAVTGGFAEITATTASVLAEKALPLADVTREAMDAFVAEAEAAAEVAGAAGKDASDKLLADMAALRAQIGV